MHIDAGLPQCINGEWSVNGDATLRAEASAVVRGIGVFNVTRTHNGVPFKLVTVIDALLAMAAKSFIPTDVTQKMISDWIETGLSLLAESKYDADVNIRMLVLGGDGQSLAGVRHSDVVILLEPISDAPASVALATHIGLRGYPEIKHTNYFEAHVSRSNVKSDGFDDILYIDHKKRVLESSKNNVMFIKYKTVIVPNHDIYFGLAREIICQQVAQSKTFILEERAVEISELSSFDGAIVTGLTHGFVPVSQIDDISYDLQSASIDKIRDLYDQIVQIETKG